MNILGKVGGVGAILGVLAVGIAFDGYFITQEGTVDSVKRNGKFERIAPPGLNFKIPLIESRTTIDTKIRKNYEEMPVSTSREMPAIGKISMNWKAKPGSIKNIIKEHGTLEKYEATILDPVLRDATKSIIAKHSAGELTTQRDSVKAKILGELLEAFSKEPIVVLGLNLEDVKFPDNYLESIAIKQAAKNEKDAEAFRLEKQALQAEQETNTKKARAAGNLALDIAKAKGIKLLGEAEAEAIDAKGRALKGNPLIVELVKAENWNGSYLTTGIGQGANTLMDLRQPATGTKGHQ